MLFQNECIWNTFCRQASFTSSFCPHECAICIWDHKVYRTETLVNNVSLSSFSSSKTNKSTSRTNQDNFWNNKIKDNVAIILSLYTQVLFRMSIHLLGEESHSVDRNGEVFWCPARLGCELQHPSADIFKNAWKDRAKLFPMLCSCSCLSVHAKVSVYLIFLHAMIVNVAFTCVSHGTQYLSLSLIHIWLFNDIWEFDDRKSRIIFNKKYLTNFEWIMSFSLSYYYRQVL